MERIIQNHTVEDKWVNEYRKVKPVLFDRSQSMRTNNEKRTVNSGIEPYSGTWGEEQVLHLLKRTLFGVRKVTLKEFVDLGMNDAIETLLTPEVTPAPPVNDYNNSEFNNQGPDPDVPLGESWVEAARNNQFEGLRIYSLKSWLLEQINHQEASIHQKLRLFWHNLLPTEMWSVYFAKASYQYWEMLFRNSLGNYRDFIYELTVDPSMLLYLNGAFNQKNAPDENYARELQELFCVGKGANSAYTEGDVQAAARVLTGWTLLADPYYGTGRLQSVFYEPNHDFGSKSFSGFYRNQVINGDGADELNHLLDMIFAQEETSLYICRRIYNFFVYHSIDETTEAQVIQPLSEIFRNHNFEIIPVLRVLFQSEHFYDRANIGAYIKNPIDHHLGLWKSIELTDLSLPNQSTEERFKRNAYLNWQMADRGMEIGDPPSVAGWQAYYQIPSFDKLWLTTDSILNRVQMQDHLVWNSGLWDLNFEDYSLIHFIEGIDDPEDPESVVRESAELLLGISPDVGTMADLVLILEPDANNPQWPLNWFDYQADPENEMKKVVVESRLKNLYYRMLQLGEFQLM